MHWVGYSKGRYKVWSVFKKTSILLAKSKSKEIKSIKTDEELHHISIFVKNKTNIFFKNMFLTFSSFFSNLSSNQTSGSIF